MFKTKQYLDDANAALPSGWELRESSRPTVSGFPTFSLGLVRQVSHECILQWPVLLDQPRRKLRQVAEAVATRGLAALVDPAFGTYTSRVAWAGYGFEIIGLRETLAAADPTLRVAFDTIVTTKEVQ